MSSYLDLINSYNLGKTDAAIGTTKVPNIEDYGQDSQGNTYITYTFLRNSEDVADTYYAGGEVEDEFATTYDQDIEDATFDFE